MKSAVAPSVATATMTRSESLRDRVIGVFLSLSGLPTQRSVDAADKTSMIGAFQTEAPDTDAVSASKRIFGSGKGAHPLVKAVNELLRDAAATFKSETLPLAAYTGAHTAEAGVRIISADAESLRRFSEKMSALQVEAVKLSEQLTAELPAIKAADKKRLRGLFSDSDYPSEIHIGVNWGFTDVNPPAALERLAPEVYRAQVARVEAQMKNTAELAISVALTDFKTVVDSLHRSLGDVYVLYPTKAALSKFAGAEELSRSRDGAKITVDLRLTDDSVETHTFDFSAYASDYNPVLQAGKRRTLRESTVASLTDFVAYFNRVGGVLCPSADFKAAVAAVNSALVKCSDASAVAKELRTSQTYRADVQNALAKARATVVKQLVTHGSSEAAADMTGRGAW